jgi:hypothetical protein
VSLRYLQRYPPMFVLDPIAGTGLGCFRMVRACLSGFGAGLLGMLTLVLVVQLCLAIPSLMDLVTAQATGALTPGLVGKSVLVSAANLLRSLWSVRLGFLAFGILGVVLAWAHRIGWALRKERAWLVSFACLASILAVSIVTWTFAQREEIALWLAERPEAYQWREFLLTSYLVDVGVSLVFAFTIAYPIWAVWRWWYLRLFSQVGSAKSCEGEKPAWAAGLVEALQKGALVRPLAILLALCVVALLLVEKYHSTVSVRLQHGVVFVDATTRPHQEVLVRIEPSARKIRVVNINGVGTVDLYLSPTSDYEQARASVEDWSFEWRSDEYLYADIPAHGLAPGVYHLHFLQESGWGYFEYTLSHGGGFHSHLAALAIGFLLAISLILGAGLLASGILRLRRSALDLPSD